jgi:hypothetical protein
MKSLGIDLLAAQNVSSLDKWEIPRDRVVINRKLGEGAFGMVYGGEALFEDKGWVSFTAYSYLTSTEVKALLLTDLHVAGSCSSEDVKSRFHIGGETRLFE